jgi:phytol kinase
MLLVCAFMAVLFGSLKSLELLLHPHPELTRKLVHVGMGMAVLTLPWIFPAAWPVVLLGGISAIFLTLMKFVPRLRDGIGTILNSVHRPSLGEICFPISVAGLTLFARGDKLLYVIPILILTLADTIAALVGIVYGKVRYITSDGLKSAEGSIAFFSIAFLSVHVPLLLFTSVGRLQSLLIAALIGILSMLIEAICAIGLDNLLIPVGAFAFLRLYEHASIESLVIRLAAIFILVIFLLCWRLRSTLDDSALIASALFGYGAAMLGGTPWVVGPLALFLVHVLMWPGHGRQREHTVYAVASVTLAGLFWLILQAAYGGNSRFFIPYAVGFGAHLAIIGVSRIAVQTSSRPPWRRLSHAILAGWALTAVQMISLLLLQPKLFSIPDVIFLSLLAVASVAISAFLFFRSLHYLYGPNGSDAAIHLAGFTSAVIGSFLAGWQSYNDLR